ncbi:MAG: hypothetical protein RLZZ501_835 [Pseudomonadota bacterium]|jgi:RimJ/RimL family protein N-acetyltransferase
MTELTDPVRLRPATLADTARIFAWQTSPGLRAFARHPEPPNWDEHQSWMTQCLTDPRRHLLVIEHRGAPAGVLRLDEIDHDGLAGREVSILIAPAHHGQGVATLALRAAVAGWNDRPLLAEIRPDHLASIRAFAKAGFRPLNESWYSFPPRGQGAPR